MIPVIKKWAPILLVLLAALPGRAAETKSEERNYLYVVAPGIRDYLEFGGAGILVFDMDRDHAFVRRITTPASQVEKPENIKGVCANAITKRLYFSTPKRLCCLDLVSEKQLWEKTLPGGCDRMSLTPDGKVLYVPSFEGPTWNVVDAATGDVIATLEPKSGAHNTVCGLDGKHMYLAGLKSPLLRVADTATHKIDKEIGPFGAAIRPFTVNAAQTLCFVNVNDLLGFEVGDLRSGKVLHRVEVQGFQKGKVKRHGCPSHGIGLTPDEKEIWICDAANSHLHVFDATATPPKQVASIPLREQPGWVTFSLDGRHAFPSTGDVVDTKTRKVITGLKDEKGREVHSEKMVQVVFHDGVPVRTGDQFGLGRAGKAVGRADDFAKEKLANWHQWRGPDATGMALQGDPPVTWDDKTNIKWKAPIPGRGASTPIIWGERIFLLTAINTGKAADPRDIPKPDPRFDVKTKPPTTYFQFVVLCLDRQSGKVLWQKTATEAVPHEGHHETHSYAASSPMTDGKYLYVNFGSRGVYCYDLDGNFQWKRDLGLMHTRLGWGEGVSPVVHGDALIVNWDQEKDSYIVCLDARSGKTKWKMDRADEPTSWATPLIVEYEGTTQVVVPGTKKVRSYDLANGKVLWECGGQTLNCIPSPVAANGMVYVVSGYRGSAAYAIPLSSRGDLTGTDKVTWKYEKGTPYVPSPLLDGDRLIFTQANNPQLTSLDIKTGKPVMDRDRLPSLDSLYASPVGVGDRIYITGRKGTTLVLKRSDKLEILATNRLEDPVDASPAIAGKQLFLRGEKHLYCIEGK